MTADMQEPVVSADDRQAAKRGPAWRRPLIDIVPAPYLRQTGISHRCFAFVLLMISSPLIALLIVLVRLGSRGPGVYRQVRVGQHGKIFVMHKLRSMVQDAEAETGPVWTRNDKDPRITPIGRFLRKSHLDELPQLWNVVQGEMALFGPRPERPELTHLLAERIPGYLNRLAVQPGITGLAQINLPPDTDIESVRRKLQIDLEYIRHADFKLNLRMFVWTCLRLIGVSASWATRLTHLGRPSGPLREAGQGPVSIDRILNSDGCAEAGETQRGQGVKPALKPKEWADDPSWQAAAGDVHVSTHSVQLSGGSSGPMKVE